MITRPSASFLYEPASHCSSGGHASHDTLLFDRNAVRAVDRAAIEEYGIPGIVLMENAAGALADQSMKLLRTTGASPASVLVVCGSGNNGGDGYALARHLHNRGVNVAIAALGAPDANTDAGINLGICRKMSLGIFDAQQLLDGTAGIGRIDLMVDAIFGTGLDRAVSGQPAEIIRWVNSAKFPVLAVDVPSGMDCNTGAVLGVAVKATCTVTFVGLKVGFIGLDAQKLLGEVVIADIGAPVELLERFGTRAVVSHHESPDHDDVETRVKP